MQEQIKILPSKINTFSADRCELFMLFSGQFWMSQPLQLLSFISMLSADNFWIKANISEKWINTDTFKALWIYLLQNIRKFWIKPVTFLCSKEPVNNLIYSPKISVSISNLIGLLCVEWDNTKEYVNQLYSKFAL